MFRTLMVLFNRETGQIATGVPIMSYSVESDRVDDFKERFDSETNVWMPYGPVFVYNGPFDREAYE